MSGSTEYRVAWGGDIYDSIRYKARKKELTDLLGGKCSDCNSKDDLEFHHVDPKTKSFTIMSKWNRSLEVLLPELEKCVLLCADCHKVKTYKGAPHGGGISGKSGCKCTPCKEKKAAYVKANRHRWS